MRLNCLTDLNPETQLPNYDPSSHDIGIVHIGPGAFHRAHQAVYTDTALSVSGGNWRIACVSLRGTDAARELSAQNGLYSVIEMGQDGNKCRVIGSIASAQSNSTDPGIALELIANPSVKIVSLTVTEKGYCLDLTRDGVDETNPAVQADLANPQAPTTVPGILTMALAARRDQGIAPFTVLSCDNLNENGAMVRQLVLGYANLFDPDLAAWIDKTVAFPSTMVDRITPERTPEILTLANSLLGVADHGVVQTEPFSQWVVEDNFPTGRPDWEAGGAIFVKDVAPFEYMKLRLLNGSHSLMAYTGYLAGHKYVRDVMADGAFEDLIGLHLGSATKTLPQMDGIDIALYCNSLIERFKNPNIAHKTRQIAMDGSEKLPQRIFEPALHAVEQGDDLCTFAFATAAWIEFCHGHAISDTALDLQDPRRDEILACFAPGATGLELMDSIFALDGLVPPKLAQNDRWRTNVLSCLEAILAGNLRGCLNNVIVTC